MGSARAQRVSISAKGLSLQKVLTEISKQAKHILIYDEKDLKDSKMVTTRFTDKPMTEALDIVLEGQRVRYSIKGRSIVISRFSKEAKESSQKIPSVSEQQDAIRGRVTDSAGNALAGVTVQVKGKNIRTLTNAKGDYEFASMDNNAILVFSSIGYVPVQLATSGRNTLNISLNIINSRIEEVEVNAGYWKINEKLQTGNISKVNGEIIRQQPVLDPMLALSGRVPGLQINQNSGLPGAYHSIRIRGNNSISNGRNPLILIDGLPFPSNTLTNSMSGGGATDLSPFALLNANEIESIEILKDADATAIYGSRGANGVILITTKKGQIGNTSFNLNAYTGVGKVTNKLQLLNTQQYLEMRREAFFNDGISDYPESAYDVNGAWDQNQQTDWQDLFIGNSSHTSNIQAQISGGVGQTQFTFGTGLLRESTVFPGDYKTSNKSANLNLNHRSVNNKFGLSISARYLNNDSDQPQNDFSLNDIMLPPNAPAIYTPQGLLNWENETWENPFAQLNQRAKATTKNLMANSSLDYKIYRNLEAKLNFGFSEQIMNQSLISPMSAYRPSYSEFSSVRSNYFTNNTLRTWIIEPQLNYNTNISKGTFAVTVGSTFQETRQSTLAQFAYDFADDSLIENLMAAAQIQVQQNQQSQYRYAAIFGRLNYNWQEKYLINLVARRDGSTRFGPGKKYGNFGSIGLGWVFSNESFFKNAFFNFGKVRASYGVTGNDQLGDYQYLSTYSSYNYPYLGITGLYPTRLYSPDFGWEEVKKMEVALDLGFLKDRLKFSSSFYHNRTGNQLVGYPLPAMTGFPSIQGNLPAVIENKGWEIEINTLNIKKNRFNWSSSFSITLPQNKLISYPDLDKSSYRNTYKIGLPLSIQNKWHWTGVDPLTGINTFEDVNGDGLISSPADLQAILNVAQKYYGGISNNFSYKNFELDFFIQFVKQIGRTLPVLAGAMGNQPNWVLDRWREPGDNKQVGRFSQGGPAYNAMADGLTNGDLFFGDASFIRLKNITLSYQLGKSLLEQIKLKNFKLYIQLQNLLTITSYKGLDPETQIGLPPLRMITAGLNIIL